MDDPVATLERLDRRIEWNDDWRLPAERPRRRRSRTSPRSSCPRFAPRVVLLALAANLWLAGWWVVALARPGRRAAPARPRVRRRSSRRYLLALGLDPEAVALSPFGPSQAGRFYGVSNLLETMLLVPALLGAWLLGRLGIAVGALALVTVAGNRFGADGGGLARPARGLRDAARVRPPVRGSARDVVAARGRGRRRRSASPLVGLDAALGGSSHVTEALGDGPAAVLGDLADRLEISARRSVRRSRPGVRRAGVARGARRGGDPTSATARDGRRSSSRCSSPSLVNDTPGDVLGWGAAAAMAVRRYEESTPRAARTSRWIDCARCAARSSSSRSS